MAEWLGRWIDASGRGFETDWRPNPIPLRLSV